MTLEPTHILLLHEFERVGLQKMALTKLNKSAHDLGATIRIPKGKTKMDLSFDSVSKIIQIGIWGKTVRVSTDREPHNQGHKKNVRSEILLTISTRKGLNQALFGVG